MESTIHLACQQNKIAVVQHLILQQNININLTGTSGWTPLHYVCKLRDVEIAQFLLEHGACVNKPNYADETPLMLAIYYKHIELAQLFIQYGANIHYQTKRKKTVLSYAKEAHAFDCMLFLVEKGVDIDPHLELLDLACIQNQYELVVVLVKHGVSVFSTDCTGQRPSKFTNDNRIKNLLVRLESVVLILIANVRPTTRISVLPMDVLRRLSEYI